VLESGSDPGDIQILFHRKLPQTILTEIAGEVKSAWAKELRSLGVEVVGDVTLHFNVWVQGKQATDHLAHLTLSRIDETGQIKTVRVFAAAIEHKAEQSILTGVKQVNNIPRTFALGKIMTSENNVYEIGKDMFVDLSQALKALGVEGDTAPALAKIRLGTGGKAYKRVVIYAPKTAGQSGLRKPGADGILRITHPISRDRMSSLYTSLAFAFNVAPRKLPK